MHTRWVFKPRLQRWYYLHAPLTKGIRACIGRGPICPYALYAHMGLWGLCPMGPMAGAPYALMPMQALMPFVSGA
jgi:hypothetical protein